MPKTDLFEIRIITASTESWDDPARTGTYPGVEYYINGIPLLDMIREIELPYCEQEGLPELVCAYSLNSKETMCRQFARALEPPKYEGADEVALYSCAACGICDCWSVCCCFREDGGYILMKDFFHNHRNWEYPFEFRFTKENWYSETAKLNAENECAEF